MQNKMQKRAEWFWIIIYFCLFLNCIGLWIVFFLLLEKTHSWWNWGLWGLWIVFHFIISSLTPEGKNQLRKAWRGY